MPKFIYRGPEFSINVAGRHVDPGVPTELIGRAADMARELPDFEELGAEAATPKPKAAPKPDGKPKSTRSSSHKPAARKSTRTTKAAAPAKSEPATPIVSSTDPTPATPTIDVSGEG